MVLKIGQDSTKINDVKYTYKVKDKLQKNILSILDFSSEWQRWLVTHKEYLPRQAQGAGLPSLFMDTSLDNLFRSLILGLRGGKIPKNKVKKMKDVILFAYGFNLTNIVSPEKKGLDPKLLVTLDKYIDTFVVSSGFSGKSEV